MFDRPEELIMAVLAAVWTVANYFFAGWATNAAAGYTFLISGCVLLWSAAVFWLWRKDMLARLLPLAVALYIGCWTFWLNWLAGGAAAWYASAWLKLIVILLPAVSVYVWQYRRNQRRRMQGLV